MNLGQVQEEIMLDAAIRQFERNGHMAPALEPFWEAYRETPEDQPGPDFIDSVRQIMAERNAPVQEQKKGFLDIFKNPNKNPYPGRTAPGRNAGEIFGNAMEQR